MIKQFAAELSSKYPKTRKLDIEEGCFAQLKILLLTQPHERLRDKAARRYVSFWANEWRKMKKIIWFCQKSLFLVIYMQATVANMNKSRNLTWVWVKNNMFYCALVRVIRLEFRTNDTFTGKCLRYIDL